MLSTVEKAHGKTFWPTPRGYCKVLYVLKAVFSHGTAGCNCPLAK